MSSYRKGRRFEYRVRDSLEREGFFVARQTRSAFPDLIAIKKGKALLIECKVDKRHFTKREREELRALAERLGVEARLYWREGRKLKWERVT